MVQVALASDRMGVPKDCGRAIGAIDVDADQCPSDMPNGEGRGCRGGHSVPERPRCEQRGTKRGMHDVLDMRF